MAILEQLKSMLKRIERIERRDIGGRSLVLELKQESEAVEQELAAMGEHLEAHDEDVAQIRSLLVDLMGQLASVHERVEVLEDVTGVRTYTCSLCGVAGDHYAPTCPNVNRCSGCGAPGHNIRTCQEVRRCGNCGQHGHNIRTCSELQRTNT